HTQHDIPNLVRNLTAQIRQYNPQSLWGSESEGGETEYPWDEFYEEDPGFASLSDWKNNVLEKLNTFSDNEDFTKDPIYSLGDTIRQAAALKYELVQEEASRIQQTKVQQLNKEYSDFFNDYYKPTKTAVANLTQKTPMQMRNDLVKLVGTGPSADKTFVLGVYGPKKEKDDSAGAGTGLYGSVDPSSTDVYVEVVDLVGEQRYYPYSKSGDSRNEANSGDRGNDDELYIEIYDPATNKYNEYKLELYEVAPKDLTPEEAAIVEGWARTPVEIGKLYDEAYMFTNYLYADSERQNALDFEETQAYREYASEIGMGGNVLANMYQGIEKLYADKLYQNAEAYKDGALTEEEYLKNIMKMIDFRDAYREQMELYLLGKIEQVSLSDISSYVMGMNIEDERLYGILQDAVQTMTEEEKQGLVKGKAHAEMLRKFDSVFEVIVDMYEGVTFYESHEGLDGTGSMGQTLQNHNSAIDTALSEFAAQEQLMRAAYNGKVTELKTKFSGAVQNLAQAIGGDTRITSFFDEATWVPAGGGDYAKLKNAVTPNATSTNDRLEKLGAAVVEAICGTEEGGYKDGLLADLGNGLAYQWMGLWRNMTKWGWIWTPMYCQLAVDQKFMRYSNTMALIQMLLTNFTSTEGLNHETSSGESWTSWWQGGGKYHLDNYPYAHDEKLRNAEVGRRIVESMTKDAFMYGESELELEAHKVLAELTGENVGSFYYRENPTEVVNLDALGYSRSVIGEDRYHDEQAGDYKYKGTIAKKYKEIADKQFLMVGQYDEPAAPMTTVPTGSGVISEYNQSVEGAINAFNGAIDAMITGVQSAELVKTADSGAYEVQYMGGTGWCFSSQMNDFDLSKFDVYALASDKIETFRTQMTAATTALFTKLMDNVFVKGRAEEPEGLRGKIQPTTGYDTEGNLRALERDIWDLTNIQLEYYEDVINMTRDSYEYGSEGTTWDDAMRGMAYGRRWVHLYGKDKFEEYYSPDPRKFTNDSTYNMVERTGTSFIKAINVLSQGQPVNMAWNNWKQYNSETGLAGGIAKNAYMISSLTDGIKQMLGDKEKVFGDMSLDYDIQDIIDYHSGAFVYYKHDGKEVTDQQQRDAITATYRRQTFDMNKIRPSRIVTTDDQGITTATEILDRLQDKRKMKADDDGKTAAEKGLLMGGIIEFNALTGAKITRVFDALGDTVDKITNFANCLAQSVLGRYGLSEVSAIALGIGIRLSKVKAKNVKTGKMGFIDDIGIERGLLSEIALDRDNLIGRLERVMEITGQDLIFLGTVGGARGSKETASLQMLTFSREDYIDLQEAKEYAKKQVELRELRMERAELEMENMMDATKELADGDRMKLLGTEKERKEKLEKIKVSIKAQREKMKEVAFQAGQTGVVRELVAEEKAETEFYTQVAELASMTPEEAKTATQEAATPQYRIVRGEDGSVKVVSEEYLKKQD
ncbi:MAG: hypothetical protein WBD00_02745, partial [Candidatus Omnitrophota bacterium]